MFNPSLASLGLFECPPDENLIGEYPNQLRRTLVSEMVSFFSNDSAAGSLFPTPAHLKFAMEIVGHGFALPLEEERTIICTIEIYKKWALNSAKQPICWAQDEQYFLQRVFLHSSVIFNVRSHDAQKTHVDLCHHVLQLWLNIGRNLEKQMSIETWGLALKTIIGVAESLFKASDSLEFGTRVASFLSKVLFELLLRSRLRDPSIWEIIRQHMSGWTHVLSFVVQWSITLVALSKRMINILFGPPEGTEQVVIRSDDVVSLDIDDDQVLYVFYRVLTLIGNPNDMTVAKSFLNAWAGIDAMVKEFLKVGMRPSNNTSSSSAASLAIPSTGSTLTPSGARSHTAKSVIGSVDGNSLLHMVGHWMFQSVRADRQSFDEGSSLALKSLCSIFAMLKNTQFLPIYLAQLYDSLNTVLIHRDGAVLLAAVISSDFLFAYEFDGAHILIPAFLTAIRKLLLKKPSEVAAITSPEPVRCACIKLLGLLLPLPAHFDQTELRQCPYVRGAGSPRSVAAAAAGGSVINALAPESSVKTYADLTPLISAALLDAMSTETFPANAQLLQSLAICYMHTYGSQDPKFAQVAAAWLSNGFTGPKPWPRDVIISALHTLSSFASHHLYRHLPRADEKGRQLATMLAKMLLSMLVHDENDKQEVLTQMFYTIADWIQADQWIVNPEFPEPATVVLEAVVQVLRPIAKKTEELNDAAEFVLQTILCGVGNFPALGTGGGPERISSLIREETELQQLTKQLGRRELAEQHMRSFFTADGRTLITVIDQPYKPGPEGRPSVLYIMRNKFGKFAWILRNIGLEPGTPPSSLMRERPSRIVSEPIAAVPTIPEEELPELMQYFRTDPTIRDRTAFYVSATPRQIAREQLILTKNHHGLAVDTVLPPPKPADPYASTRPSSQLRVSESRQLLTHLGFFGDQALGKVVPAAITDQFLSSLAQLDAVPEREALKFGVLLLDSMGKNVVTGGGGNLDYFQFALSLGWLVDPATHRGYLGGLDASIADRAIYYADHRSEMLFHASALLPHLRPIQDALVNAVWCVDLDSFDPAVLFAHKSLVTMQAQVVIAPMSSGLYHVRIFRRNEAHQTRTGPLYDGMILSRRSLGPIVREGMTILHRWYAAQLPDCKSQPGRRAQQLEEIFRRHGMAEMSLAQFLSYMFVSSKTRPAPANNAPVTQAVAGVVPTRGDLSPHTGTAARAIMGIRAPLSNDSPGTSPSGNASSPAGSIISSPKTTGWQNSSPLAGERRQSFSIRGAPLPLGPSTSAPLSNTPSPPPPVQSSTASPNPPPFSASNLPPPPVPPVPSAPQAIPSTHSSMNPAQNSPSSAARDPTRRYSSRLVIGSAPGSPGGIYWKTAVSPGDNASSSASSAVSGSSASGPRRDANNPPANQ